MSRYIDAELIDFSCLKNDFDRARAKIIIMGQPTADVVEVVRCKDCKHCTLTEEGEYNPEDIVCVYFMTDGLQANDYCSHGERREG